MTVTDKEKGTKTKEEEQANVASKSKVETPDSESKVSSEEEPKIYTQRQADALTHAAKSELGRQVKDIEMERDTLKSQIRTKDAELENNTEDIKGLEEKLDDLSKDDPARFDAIKELKGAREERRQLKVKLASLDDRDAKLGEREKRVDSFELEVLIESIADEYEDGDTAQLKAFASSFENPTEEQVRKFPDIVGWKNKAGEGKKPKAPKPYSGKSEGGSPYYTREQISDRAFWEEHKDDILKAQKEGRIKE